jgi:hypothetical protein
MSEVANRHQSGTLYKGGILENGDDLMNMDFQSVKPLELDSVHSNTN